MKLVSEKKNNFSATMTCCTISSVRQTPWFCVQLCMAFMMDTHRMTFIVYSRIVDFFLVFTESVILTVYCKIEITHILFVPLSIGMLAKLSLNPTLLFH